MHKPNLTCNNLNTRLVHKTAWVLITLVALTSFSACGKRKAPQPPPGRVKQRAEITGLQRGNQIILSWNLPTRNSAPNSVDRIERADVYRLVEPLAAPLSLTEDEFSLHSTLIASVPITQADFSSKSFSYVDVIDSSGQAARLRYAIRFVNGNGQKAAFSNFLLIQPANVVAAPPGSLSAAVGNDSITLKWTRPAGQAGGSDPAEVLGYNIYRNGKLINKTPVIATIFDDKLFSFGEVYTYTVRAIAPGPQAEPIESLDSEPVTLTPVDRFPPTAPAALTIAAAPTSLSIFFAPNPERDVAGYNVFRSEDPALPSEKWSKINASLLTTNTFRDSAVSSGRTYYYFISAVDTAGNASPASEVVHETVP
jgi:hypothetical protein